MQKKTSFSFHFRTKNKFGKANVNKIFLNDKRFYHKYFAPFSLIRFLADNE